MILSNSYSGPLSRSTLDRLEPLAFCLRTITTSFPHQSYHSTGLFILYTVLGQNFLFFFFFFQNEVYCLPSRSIIVSSELRTPKSTRSLRSAALGSLKIHFYLAPTAAVRCGEPTFTFMIKMLPELQFFFRNREDILEEIINETYDRLSVVNCNTQPSHVMAPCTDLNFGAIDLSTPRLRGGD